MNKRNKRNNQKPKLSFQVKTTNGTVSFYGPYLLCFILAFMLFFALNGAGWFLSLFLGGFSGLLTGVTAMAAYAVYLTEPKH